MSEKKLKYLRVRTDEALKAALTAAAERDVRTEADEARYLLMKALGLLAAEDTSSYKKREAPGEKKVGNHDG